MNPVFLAFLGQPSKEAITPGDPDHSDDSTQIGNVSPGASGGNIVFGPAIGDQITGGDGIDHAQFRGKETEYNITETANGFVVVDTIAGRDGTDTLTNIEELIFLGDAPPPPSEDPVVIQVEDMELVGYNPQNVGNADGGQVAFLGREASGSASQDLAALDIGAGEYSISVTFFDESDGESVFDLLINDTVIGTVIMDQDGGGGGTQAENLRTVTFEGVDIPEGATLSIVATADDGERARLDVVEITPTGSVSPPPPPPPPPVNEDPVGVDDIAETEGVTPVAIDVLANDTDGDGDDLTIESFGSGTNGTVTQLPDGRLEYTANDGFVGTDTFNYIVSDGNGGTDSADVSVTVTASPPPPPPSEILGTTGDDLIFGTPDGETILGLSGNDFINGESGNDTLFGGEGDDSLVGSFGNDVINAGSGDDEIDASYGSDIIIFEPGNDIDAIINFDLPNDQIDVSAFGLTASAALNLLVQPGRNISALFMPGGDTLLVLNTLPGDLTESNFIGIDTILFYRYYICIAFYFIYKFSFL